MYKQNQIILIITLKLKIYVSEINYIFPQLSHVDISSEISQMSNNARRSIFSTNKVSTVSLNR